MARLAVVLKNREYVSVEGGLATELVGCDVGLAAPSSRSESRSERDEDGASGDACSRCERRNETRRDNLRFYRAAANRAFQASEKQRPSTSLQG